MARTASRGLEYTSFDTDFFTDRKIRRLQRHFDELGPIVYFAVVLYILKDDYYIHYDEETCQDIADFAHISVDFVNDGIRSCLEVGLLNQQMFDEHQILTSAGIQRQWLASVEKMKRRAKVEEYSLIDEGNSFGNIPKQSETIQNVSETFQKTSETFHREKEKKESKETIESKEKKESSFSFNSFSSYDEREKFVYYFTFVKNWPQPNAEYDKLVAYNSGPKVEKKWSMMTDMEKQSCLALWHQEPEKPERSSKRWLDVWLSVYHLLRDKNAPDAVRQAALADGVTWRDGPGQEFHLIIPTILQEWMDANATEVKPIIWPFIQKRHCEKLIYNTCPP